jgi:membrane-associated phospholipid phosphatase
MDAARQATFRRYLVIMLIGYAAWIALYYFTGWIGALRGPAFDAELSVDARIPLVAWFQPLYLLCYLVTLGLFLISLEPSFLNRAYLMFIAANGFAFVFFMAFPVLGPPRDPIPIDASGGQWLLLFNHAMDTRYNAFPSLHVANPWLVALLCLRERGLSAHSIFFTLIAVLISIATLFVKQHYLLDVLAGFILAVVTFLAFRRVRVGSVTW